MILKPNDKTVIYISKPRADQSLFLFCVHWLLFNNLTDLQKNVEIKKNFALAIKISKC